MNKLKVYVGVERSTIFPSDKQMREFPVIDELEKLILKSEKSKKYALGWQYVQKAFEQIDVIKWEYIINLKPGGQFTVPMEVYNSEGVSLGLRNIRVLKKLIVDENLVADTEMYELTMSGPKYGDFAFRTIFLMLEYGQEIWRVHVQAFDKTGMSNSASKYFFYQPYIEQANEIYGWAHANPAYEQFL